MRCRFHVLLQNVTFQSNAATYQRVYGCSGTARCSSSGLWWSLPVNIGHKEQLASRQEVTDLFGLECPLVFILSNLYSASKMFPYWLLLFAFWCEQLTCGAEQEQHWCFVALIYHFFLLFQLSTLCCVLQRATVALAVEGKANQKCQTPLLLNSH